MAEGVFSRRNGSGGASPSFFKKRNKSAAMKASAPSDGWGRINELVGPSQETDCNNNNYGFDVEDLMEQDELDYLRKQSRAYLRRYEKEHADCYDRRDKYMPAQEVVDEQSTKLWTCTRTAVAQPVGGDAMEDVTGDGGVRKRILQSASENAEGVTEGCRVWIHYNLYLDNGPGSELILQDSTDEHGMATSIKIGSSGILGLQMGLRTMKVGEIAELALRPSYAYGSLGVPNYIGKNQGIRIIVELMSVSSQHLKPLTLVPPSERKHASTQQVLDEIDRLMKAGKAKFNHGVFGDACERYQWALNLIQDHFLSSDSSKNSSGEETLRQQVEHKAYKIYSNLALCFLRREKFEDAQEACEVALKLSHQLDSIKPKVWCRLAKAKYLQEKYLEAKQDCITALNIVTWGHAELRSIKGWAERALKRQEAMPQGRGGYS